MGEGSAGSTAIPWSATVSVTVRTSQSRPDGKVGHDAFAVIRETIRNMNMVAIGTIVLTSREHITALEPLERPLALG